MKVFGYCPFADDWLFFPSFKKYNRKTVKPIVWESFFYFFLEGNRNINGTNQIFEYETVFFFRIYIYFFNAYYFYFPLSPLTPFSCKNDRMDSSKSALVIYGNTGRAIQITLQDLQMPDHIKEKTNSSFFKKQWNAVAAFWYNRVLKEYSLQQKSIDDIVQLIENDIDKRWAKRKLESTLRKKRARLLSSGSAGTPSSRILLTNVCALDDYNKMNEEERRELESVLVEKIQSVTSSQVFAAEVLIDTDNLITTEPDEKRKKKEVVDEIVTLSTEYEFDDRIAFVFSLETKELAARAIVQLHGAQLNQRRVLCRFWN